MRSRALAARARGLPGRRGFTAFSEKVYRTVYVAVTNEHAKSITCDTELYTQENLFLDLDQRVVDVVAALDLGAVRRRVDELDPRAAQARGEFLERRQVIQFQHQRLRIADRVFVEEQRRVRMRRPARHACAVRASYHRLEREPGYRGALLLGLIDHVAVNGQRQGHFARYDHVGQDRIAAAYRKAVARRDAAEEVRA